MIAQHEVVPAQGNQGLLGDDLTQGRRFRRQDLKAAKQDDFPNDFCRTQMNAHPLVVHDLAARARPNFNAGIKTGGRHLNFGMTHDMATRHIRLVQSDQIQRNPLPPMRFGPVLPVDLERTHARFSLGRKHPHGLTFADRSGQRCPGYNNPVPLERKDPIDRQPKVAGLSRPAIGFKLPGNLLLQPVQALAGHRRDRQDGRVFKNGVNRQNLDFFPDLFNPLGADHIGFGNNEESLLDAQQVEKIEMLLGLGHHPIVRGNGKQHQVYALGAGQHIADKTLVTGHINDPDPLAVGQIQIGKAEINGDAPFLFLFEPVGIVPGQSLEQ